MQKYAWSIKVYRKASFIISDITGTRMNTETLINNIMNEVETLVNAI